MGRKGSRVGISEALACMLYGLKAAAPTHGAIPGCDLPNPFLVLPRLCPVSRAAVSLASRLARAAGWVWPLEALTRNGRWEAKRSRGAPSVGAPSGIPPGSCASLSPQLPGDRVPRSSGPPWSGIAPLPPRPLRPRGGSFPLWLMSGLLTVPHLPSQLSDHL